MSGISDALRAWNDVRRNHRDYLLTSPEGRYIHEAGNRVVGELAREIAALRDLVDGMENVPVIYCADRDHEVMMAQSAHELPGTILRATDTLREWVKTGARWEPHIRTKPGT